MHSPRGKIFRIVCVLSDFSRSPSTRKMPLWRCFYSRGRVFAHIGPKATHFSEAESTLPQSSPSEWSSSFSTVPATDETCSSPTSSCLCRLSEPTRQGRCAHKSWPRSRASQSSGVRGAAFLLAWRAIMASSDTSARTRRRCCSRERLAVARFSRCH